MEMPIISILIKQARVIGRLPLIRIRAAAGDPRRGWLTAAGRTIPVALGRGGIIANKREGDGGTPKGHSGRGTCGGAPTAIRGRATLLPVRAIGPDDAWCEDPPAGITISPCGSNAMRGGDRLTRDDHLYDFIVEIDHTRSPRVRGRGSAVFLHLARDEFLADGRLRLHDAIGDAALVARGWVRRPGS